MTLVRLKRPYRGYGAGTEGKVTARYTVDVGPLALQALRCVRVRIGVDSPVLHLSERRFEWLFEVLP